MSAMLGLATLARVGTAAVLAGRASEGPTTEGPMGILTLPPAPTVDQAELVAGVVAVGLLARSAYRFPPEIGPGNVGAAVRAAAASFCFLSSSSFWMSASVFLLDADVEAGL